MAVEIQVDAAQAWNRGAVDFNFFAGLCLPSVMRYTFPEYYIALFHIIVQAVESGNEEGAAKLLRYALGLPRGFAKTTFLKCIVCWLICYDKLSFILVICATEPLAQAFLADVHAILQTPNMEAVYGRWNPAIDNADTKKGAYHRRLIVLKAKGSGSSVRGINEGNQRPQFILCDDMQTKENDSSESERTALFDWFIGTLLKTVDPAFALCFYIGNMYSDHCILYQLKVNPYWTSLITGAILSDGSSLWPELHSIADLYDSFLHDESMGKADLWFAEVMNDPVESATSLLDRPIPVEVIDIIPRPDAAFITVDPAGFRDTSDDNVIAAHNIIDNIGYVVEMDGGVWDPGKVATRSIEMAIEHEASHIFVEGISYQQTLSYWINVELTRLNITGIQCLPLDRPQSKSKLQYIRLFVAELVNKTYKFLRPQDRAKFVWQASNYKMGRKKNKDDWMDAPAMGMEVRNKYAAIVTTRSNAPPRRARVISNNTPF